MSVADLDVLIVSWFSTSWVERLVDNLRRRATNPLRFIVVDNSGGEDAELERLARRTAGLELVRREREELTGSFAHAAGLALGVARCTARHLLVTDPDVHVFLDRWDAHLVAELETTGAIASGAPYPWWKLGKYHDFPSPVFLLARTADLRDLGNDWFPFARERWRRIAQRTARQLVRLGPLGTRRRLLRSAGLARLSLFLERRLGVCAPDTGWRMAAAARRRGHRVSLFSETVPRDAAARWGTASAFVDLARHFELFTFRGEPIVVHRYSTNGLLWRTPRSADEAFWFDRVRAAEAEAVNQPTAPANRTRSP